MFSETHFTIETESSVLEWAGPWVLKEAALKEDGEILGDSGGD